MVAVQNLEGEIIQLILSRKGGGMYLVSATPTKPLDVCSWLVYFKDGMLSP
jgi:hypothetical protein